MLTVKQMIQNAEKGSSVGGYRGYILAKYEEYNKSTKKSLELVTTSLPYKNNYPDPYFVAYYKILSQGRHNQNVWYDVFIQFNTGDRITADTLIRVFCNSPQFTYTYAYCYNKTDDLLFPQLYDKLVLSEPPKIKNPSCLKGMDKHVYVALKQSLKNRLTYNYAKTNNKPLADIQFLKYIK